MPLAVRLTDFPTGELVGCWLTQCSHRGLQQFPVLILNQCAQARVERHFTLSSQLFQMHLEEEVVELLWAQFVWTHARKSFDTEN